MRDSKASERSLPYVWPFPVDESESRPTGENVPYEEVTAAARSISGVVSDIDAHGVAWLEDLLDEPKREARIVLAVYAGCRTRSEQLTRLLEIQRRDTSRIEFRILPVTAATGAPANCLTVIPRDERNPVCLFGGTPNFGISRYEPTQFNVAFRAELELIDEWYSWFDRTRLRAAPLTERTTNIPSLIPATGSTEAANQWRDYCKVCADEEQEEETQQAESSATLVQNIEASIQTSVSNQPTRQSTSASSSVSRLMQLVARVTRLLKKGRLITVVSTGAVGPLDIPVSARFFNQKSEDRDEFVVHRQSFRISAFTEEEQQQIDTYRNQTRTVMNILGLPFERGLRWMSGKMIPIFKKELVAVELEAGTVISRLVRMEPETFIKGRRIRIKKALDRTYRKLGGEGDLPPGKLKEALDQLEKKIQKALDSGIVTPVSFLDVAIDLQRAQAHEDPWKQVETLILALARFPRQNILRPKSFPKLTTEPALINDAMNVQDDAIVTLNESDPVQATRNAKRELHLLDQIADSDIETPYRCMVYLMIIEGKSDAEIYRRLNTL